MSNKKLLRPIAIDLFSGVGGFSLGMEKAGFDIACAIDVDPIHCAAYQYNFPLTNVICSPIESVNLQTIHEITNINAGDLDLLFGGAPCQGFSSIGKRAIEDPRNRLLYHFLRLIRELRPKYFILENVPGLTYRPHVKLLLEFIHDAQCTGYEIRQPYQILDASNFGVPQKRKRLFILGARRDVKPLSYPDTKEGRVSVREALVDLPDADQYPELWASDSVEAEFGTPTRYSRELRAEHREHNNHSYARSVRPSWLTASLRTRHQSETVQKFSNTPQGEVEPVSRLYRLDPHSPARTLRSGTDSAHGAFTSPRPIHPWKARCLTNREAARLHSFPDWFRFHKTKWHGFRQIGNSVPPFLAEAVGERVIAALNHVAIKPHDEIKLQNEQLLEFNPRSAAEYYGLPFQSIPVRARNTSRKP